MKILLRTPGKRMAFRWSREIVAQDNTTLQYVDAVKVIPESVLGVEEVWVLSNRYQAFVQNLLDFDEYNFHILRAPAKNLVTGTKCEPPLKVAQELKKRERNLQEQWDSVQGFRYEY
ncbi:hypothetical protein QAD02_022839 [Eretmocerus hayati]|uniref:Uncharacterized protein n=1 Tax=Eretmocerus hayati TaxID=131215 RepID=A0ACC2PZ22_9HYME|nr:hypothetical protein QAD02_022839 [Eretmocerus hayati]